MLVAWRTPFTLGVLPTQVMAEDTLVTLGTAIVLVGVLVGAVFWAASLKKDVERMADMTGDLKGDVAQLRVELQQLSIALAEIRLRGVITRTEFIAWVAESRRQTGLDLPFTATTNNEGKT